MATTMAISEKEFLSRASLFIGRSNTIRYNRFSDHAPLRFEQVLNDVSRYARYNEEDGLPRAFDQVVYGLQWSVNTGRLNGQTVLALRALKVRELLKLIFEVSQACSNMGEYPAYLMQKYTK